MKIKLILVFIQVAAILVSSTVFADRPAPPRPYKQVTSDSGYVFVMLPLDSREDFEGYNMSGLYRNDGSKKPLWTANWFAWGVKMASDGVHLVRQGPWASRPNDEAVTFFASGVPLLSYKIKDLVRFPRLMPHSVSHFYWRAYTVLDEINLLYILITLHGEYYVFDITNGKIISSFQTSLWIVFLIIPILMYAILIRKSLFMTGILSISAALLVFHNILFFIPIFFGLYICGIAISYMVPEKLKNKITTEGDIILKKVLFIVVIILLFGILSDLRYHIFRSTMGLHDNNDKAKSVLIPIPPNPEEHKTYTNSVGMNFVYISPGKFVMGSEVDELGRRFDEMMHEVTLTKGFYMQTTEVTLEQWEAVMGADSPTTFPFAEGDEYPMEGVSWFNAQDFINRLNQMERGNHYRLPYEAEWEYACKAGSSGPYSRMKPNAWGINDLHDNVSEWCMDRYGDYWSGNAVDPIGSPSGRYRVTRGCKRDSRDYECRCAVRFHESPGGYGISTGFRVVIEP